MGGWGNQLSAGTKEARSYDSVPESCRSNHSITLNQRFDPVFRRSPPARGLHSDCFALRNLCEPRHDRCSIAVQDLLARILTDLRIRKRLADPLATEFSSVGAAYDALGAVQAHRRLDRTRAERIAIHVHLNAAETRRRQFLFRCIQQAAVIH